MPKPPAKHSNAHIDDEDYITKSQVKRDAEALKTLGKEIYDLPLKKRNKLPLNNALLVAFEEADRIKNLNALRRHFQYIGKILRDTDVDAIRSAIDTLETSPITHQRNDARLEQMIEKLLAPGSKNSEDLIQENSQLDRQKLNQLVRNALKTHTETNEDDQPEVLKVAPASPARKKLKRYLKDNLNTL
ncbi:MAG: DUF615 domain-containing protein [Gammaproteobacteria bacterium]|nr:DUF615 domain-containing protein [Gammaproteobacteria bacterium]